MLAITSGHNGACILHTEMDAVHMRLKISLVHNAIATMCKKIMLEYEK